MTFIYLPPKLGGCPDAPPNIEPPNGDGGWVAADGAPKEPKFDCVAVASEGWEPNPLNEKPVGGPDEVDCVLNPEKPLPNVDGAVEAAGNVEVNPKPLLPNTPELDVDVGAGEAAAPNPPNVVPVDAAPNPPNELALGVDAAGLKLAPNGDVAVVLLPNPPLNEPVLGAEVVAAAAAAILPNPPPNGLEVVFVAAPNIPAVGADVVAAVAAGATNPLPNGLGTEVVAVVVVVAPNPPPNEVGVGAVEVIALPKSEPVFADVAVLPNGIPEEVVDVKLNAVPPNIGLDPNEPKLVGIIGFVVGEVDWTDVVTVEAGDKGAPNDDWIDDGVEITGVAVVAVIDVANGDWLITGAADVLGVFPKNGGLIPWFDVEVIVGWFGMDVMVVVVETVLLSNDRIALSPDIDIVCALDRSVAVWIIGLFGWSLSAVSDEIGCVAGVAGVTEIVGSVEVTDFAGVCTRFVRVIVVFNGLVIFDVFVIFVVLEIFGVLLIDTTFDFCVDDKGLVAIVFDNSCNCSGLVVPENKSIDVRTIRNIFLKLSDSIVGEFVCFGVDGWIEGVIGLVISIVDCFFCSIVDDKLITVGGGTSIRWTCGWVACKCDKICASNVWNDRLDDIVVLVNVELLLNKFVLFNFVQIFSKSFSVSDTLWLSSSIRFWILCFIVSFVFNEISKSGKKSSFSDSSSFIDNDLS